MIKKKGLALLLCASMAIAVCVTGCTGIGAAPEGGETTAAISSGSASASAEESAAESAETSSASQAASEETAQESEGGAESSVATGRGLGLYIDEPSILNDFEVKPQFISWFENIDGSNASNKKLSICLDEDDITPIITLQPYNFLLEDLAAGAADDYLIQFFSRMTSGDRANKTVIVRFAHEMEMTPDQEAPWYTWQTRDTDTYIAAWRHVVELGRQYAPNIKWLWSPTKAIGNETAYYPGDDWVDYVGVTVNEFESEGMYDTFEEFYEVCGKTELESYGKPIILPECSYGGTDEDAKRAYLQSMYDYIENPNNNIEGIVIFNFDKTEERQFKFTDNPDQLSDFKEAIKALAGAQ